MLTSSRSSMNSDSDNIFMFFFSHGTERERGSTCLPHHMYLKCRCHKKAEEVSNSNSINSGRRTLSFTCFVSLSSPFLSVLSFCPLSFSVRVTWNVFGFFPSSSSLSALSLCSSPRSPSFVPCRECFHSCVVLSLGKTRV